MSSPTEARKPIADTTVATTCCAYRRQKSVLGKLRQRIAVPLFIALRPTWGRDRLKADLDRAGFGSTPISYHDHHQTHAATAYYGLRANSAEKYLVLTCDGDGDGLVPPCASWGAARIDWLRRLPGTIRSAPCIPGSLLEWALCRWNMNTS